MNPLDRIESFLEELIKDSEIFLIKSDMSTTNDIKIYLDGDNGLPINAISKINRSLYQRIEEEALFSDGNFSLEVSSPGVDEPLIFNRQYHKHIGRKLELSLSDEVIVGKLISVNDESITLEVEINKKKKETQQQNINFNQIKKAIVQISF